MQVALDQSSPKLGFPMIKWRLGTKILPKFARTGSYPAVLYHFWACCAGQSAGVTRLRRKANGATRPAPTLRPAGAPAAPTNTRSTGSKKKAPVARRGDAESMPPTGIGNLAEAATRGAAATNATRVVSSKVGAPTRSSWRPHRAGWRPTIWHRCGGCSNAPALHTTQVELYWLAKGSQTSCHDRQAECCNRHPKFTYSVTTLCTFYRSSGALGPSVAVAVAASLLPAAEVAAAAAAALSARRALMDSTCQSDTNAATVTSGNEAQEARSRN